MQCYNNGHFWEIIRTKLQGKPVFFYYFCIVYVNDVHQEEYLFDNYK